MTEPTRGEREKGSTSHIYYDEQRSDRYPASDIPGQSGWDTFWDTFDVGFSGIGEGKIPENLRVTVKTQGFSCNQGPSVVDS